MYEAWAPGRLALQVVLISSMSLSVSIRLINKPWAFVKTSRCTPPTAMLGIAPWSLRALPRSLPMSPPTGIVALAAIALGWGGLLLHLGEFALKLYFAVS